MHYIEVYFANNLNLAIVRIPLVMTLEQEYKISQLYNMSSERATHNFAKICIFMTRYDTLWHILDFVKGYFILSNMIFPLLH